MKKLVVLVEGVLAVLYSAFALSVACYFLDSISRNGFPGGGVSGVEVLALCLMFFVFPLLAMVFMIELVVLQLGRSRVSWVTFLCFFVAVFCQIHSFGLAFGSRKFGSFFFAFLVVALLWRRWVVERACAARLDLA